MGNTVEGYSVLDIDVYLYNYIISINIYIFTKLSHICIKIKKPKHTKLNE